MVDLSTKTDDEITTFIKNYEVKSATNTPFYHELLEERARRTQVKNPLVIEKSLELLRQAAIEQSCVTYSDLAKASNVDWKQARHKMSGPNGHLDRLLDICHARGLPMLPALCVNQSGREKCELEVTALAGFVAGARRVGFAVSDEVAFHHSARAECWRWGSEQNS